MLRSCATSEGSTPVTEAECVATNTVLTTAVANIPALAAIKNDLLPSIVCPRVQLAWPQDKNEVLDSEKKKYNARNNHAGYSGGDDIVIVHLGLMHGESLDVVLKELIFEHAEGRCTLSRHSNHHSDSIEHYTLPSEIPAGIEHVAQLERTP